MSIDPLLQLILALVLGGLFLVAATGKLMGFRAFTATLANYNLFPAWLSRPVAAVVVGLEIVVAAMLLSGWQRHVGFAIAAALLLGYAVGIAINLLRGRRHIDCGCIGFGARRPYLGWPLVLRNIGLAAMATAGATLPVSARALGAIDMVSLIAAPLAFAVLYSGFGQLLVSAASLTRSAR